jgi:NADPH-dependent curcumin reductase
MPSMTTYHRIVLASRPVGPVAPDNFRLEELSLPACGAGQVLVRNRFLSLDPYMRPRMYESKSYAAPQPLGATMIGETAGEVVESHHPKFAVGDEVVGLLGWCEAGVCDGAALRKVDTTHVPLSAHLGVVGMPGVTAWYGLNRIIAPKAGDTVVVSAASGAVGSVVGQLARQHGCRAVGVAGGADKCAYVTGELGLDACIDYQAASRDGGLDVVEFARRLEAAAPNGIDGYFDNVGGRILDGVMARMNAFGRIAICGVISAYDGTPLPLKSPQLILLSRLRLEGFIVSEHLDVWPQALAELGEGVASGRIRYRETIAQGLASAPQAFMGLLKGRNFGKQLVALG